MYFVYILKSIKDGKYYIGSSNNPEERLLYHNSGRQRSTKYRIPFKLIYKEEFLSKPEALIREKQIKSLRADRLSKK